MAYKETIVMQKDTIANFTESKGINKFERTELPKT